MWLSWLKRLLDFSEAEAALHGERPAPPPPLPPGPKVGDTRIRVVEYGDGRVKYYPEYVSLVSMRTGKPNWEGCWVTLGDDAPGPYGSLEYAKAVLDKHIEYANATRTVGTTYIKYP